MLDWPIAWLCVIFIAKSLRQPFLKVLVGFSVCQIMDENNSWQMRNWIEKCSSRLLRCKASSSKVTVRIFHLLCSICWNIYFIYFKPTMNLMVEDWPTVGMTGSPANVPQLYEVILFCRCASTILVKLVGKTTSIFIHWYEIILSLHCRKLR